MALLRLACGVLALCGWLLAGAALAAPPSGTYQLHFALMQQGVQIAEVEEQLTLRNKDYTLSSVTMGKGLYKLMGERSLQSQGQVVNQRLRPQAFESRQSKRPEKALVSRFDWAKKRLNMQVKDTQSSEALTANTQDLLSVMYCWMLQPPKAGDIQMSVTNGKKLAPHVFHVSEVAQPLQTEAGVFRVIKLDDSDGEKTLYLAKDRHYLPVKLVLHQDGKDLEQIITQISGP